ncbi:5-phosphohydroxy-L-lysine phospho-lyase-like [Glandiceps talaboti]
MSATETLMLRRDYVGGNCSLHFDNSPLQILEAKGQYMYDDMGQKYLDAVNNVAHVGHCHPKVVKAGQDQMALLNANFGYVHEKQIIYAKKLTATLPEKLCVCFFVNTGSEANDLALQLARHYTKNSDIIAINHAYHGNLTSILDISPGYNAGRGFELKDWVHVVPCPDTYRGIYRDDTLNPGEKYANEVKKVIDKAHTKGRRIATFISDTIIAAAGNVVSPKNYLKNVYSHVREAGGLCIADEVQVGYGRTGVKYWGFETQDVIPDIVTIGKPIGNGHPMAAVITTKDIARSFGDGGRPYANTFGGNPVSCAIGIAVFDVMKEENLMLNAHKVGEYLLVGLRKLMEAHFLIGHVRGMGLVIGVEIMADRHTRKPATELAEKIVYKMKEDHILISNIGPDKNVLKIEPPLCFTVDNATQLIDTLDMVLTEIECQQGLVSDTTRQDCASVSGFVPLDIISGESNPNNPNKRKQGTAADKEVSAKKTKSNNDMD